MLVPALCLVLSASAFAQERAEQNRRAVHPASDIIGMDVRNTKNESLGHVEDIVIRMRDGKCMYMAMARGQVLGFGGSLFAIAPEAISMSADGEYLILNATSQEFENAKGFDQNNWPRQPDRRWGKAGDNRDANRDANAANRDVTAREEGKGEDHLARVTSLQNLAVYGRDDKQIGRIYDLAMDCNKHQVAYAAVHHGGTLGIGGKLVAVAWDAFTMKAPALDPQRRAFFLNATQQELERAPSFTTDNWPAQAAPTFRRGGTDATNRQDNP